MPGQLQLGRLPSEKMKMLQMADGRLLLAQSGQCAINQVAKSGASYPIDNGISHRANVKATNLVSANLEAANSEAANLEEDNLF